MGVEHSRACQCQAAQVGSVAVIGEFGLAYHGGELTLVTAYRDLRGLRGVRGLYRK